MSDLIVHSSLEPFSKCNLVLNAANPAPLHCTSMELATPTTPSSTFACSASPQSVTFLLCSK